MFLHSVFFELGTSPLNVSRGGGVIDDKEFFIHQDHRIVESPPISFNVFKTLVFQALHAPDLKRVLFSFVTPDDNIPVMIESPMEVPKISTIQKEQ